MKNWRFVFSMKRNQRRGHKILISFGGRRIHFKFGGRRYVKSLGVENSYRFGLFRVIVCRWLLISGVELCYFWIVVFEWGVLVDVRLGLV